ncbi:hypothetical protein [Bacillus dakarensis]|nr:hypothetical protein [Bacillus dakarensis]
MDSIERHKKFTAAGTDIEAVKQLNKNSGLSYNAAKALLARQFLNKNK